MHEQNLRTTPDWRKSTHLSLKGIFDVERRMLCENVSQGLVRSFRIRNSRVAREE